MALKAPGDAKVRRAPGRPELFAQCLAPTGPAFLPSEHDDLPPGVAFMVSRYVLFRCPPLTPVQSLEGHATPITSLDLSEPYGLLVSASQEESQPHVWDLMTGVEIGRLKGHRGTVKCTQVEDSVCVTGAEDGAVRLWDLRKVGDSELPRVVEEEEELQEEEDGELVQHPNGIRNGQEDMPAVEQSPASVRVLEGHSKSVTALYFEDDCLVSFLQLLPAPEVSRPYSSLGDRCLG